MKCHWKIGEATCWPAQGVGQSVVGEGQSTKHFNISFVMKNESKFAVQI